MTTLPTYTKADIRDAAGATIYERGEEYYNGGMVNELVLRDGTLHAEVEGSQYEPYQATIHFTDSGFGTADCTCPYGGWCKHVVAALLAALAEPERVAERADLATLLEPLDRAQLQELLLALTDEQPALIATIEGWLALRDLAAKTAAATPSASVCTAPTTTAPTTTAPTSTIPAIDPKQIQKDVRSALRGVSRADAATQLLEQVRKLLNSGATRHALTLLYTLTDEFIQGMPSREERYGYDYYGDYDDYDYNQDDDSYAWFETAMPLWAEVLLSVDLATDEKDELQADFDEWSGALMEGEYEIDFTVPELALEYDWAYPPLQAAMQGHITEKGAWEDEAPYGADELAVARLNVLARQGRTTEYLNLAEAEGQTYYYVLMLAGLGRIAEAVAEGKQYLQPHELLVLAQTLESQDAVEEAIEVANHALAKGEGDLAPIAQWLRDLHIERGDITRAIPVAIQALAAAPGMADYRQLQTLAGNTWPTVREQALAALRDARTLYGSGSAKAEIFLHEEQWDDAIKTVDNDYYGATGLEMVIKALYAHRPDWVIRRSLRIAEEIMDAGKSDRYDVAVKWLGHAKAAYLANGRKAEWERYFSGIRSKHERKRKLMGLVKGL